MLALHTLKAYEEEATALEALLGQRRWRRGKRAKWYEKRALLQTRYLCYVEGPDGAERDFGVLHQAMEGVKEALRDEDTGLSQWLVFFSNSCSSLSYQYLDRVLFGDCVLWRRRLKYLGRKGASLKVN